MAVKMMKEGTMSEDDFIEEAKVKTTFSVFDHLSSAHTLFQTIKL